MAKVVHIPIPERRLQRSLAQIAEDRLGYIVERALLGLEADLEESPRNPRLRDEARRWVETLRRLKEKTADPYDY